MSEIRARLSLKYSCSTQKGPTSSSFLYSLKRYHCGVQGFVVRDCEELKKLWENGN
jgi:hypothetical protein